MPVTSTFLVPSTTRRRLRHKHKFKAKRAWAQRQMCADWAKVDKYWSRSNEQFTIAFMQLSPALKRNVRAKVKRLRAIGGACKCRCCCSEHTDLWDEASRHAARCRRIRGGNKRDYIKPMGARRRRGLKRTIRIATWNLCGYGNVSKPSDLEADLERLGVDFIGLTEMHMQEDRPTKFRTPAGKYEVLQFGKQQRRRGGGVAIAYRKKYASQLLTYAAIPTADARVGRATFALHGGRKLHLLVVYAYTLPVSETQPHLREELYKAITTELRSLPNRDPVYLLGDFNAVLGSRDADEAADLEFMDCVGKYGRGERNANGERMLEMMAECELFAVNTAFKHRAGRTATWESPPRWNKERQRTVTYRKQLDYICCKQRERRHCVRSHAHALTQLQSDHKPVIADFERRCIAFTRTKKAAPTRKQRLDIDKLHDPAVRERYAAAVEAELCRRLPQSIEELNEAIKAAAYQVLGVRTPERRTTYRWLKDAQVRRLSREQKMYREQLVRSQGAARLLLKTLRKAALKQLKARIRQCYEEEAIDRAQRLEATKNFAKRHHMVLRELGSAKRGSGGLYLQNDKLEFVAGTEALNAEATRAMSAKFGGALAPTVQRTTAGALHQPITSDEVRQAMKRLPNGRATGPDDAESELYKYALQRVDELRGDGHPRPIEATIAELLNDLFISGRNAPEIGQGRLVLLQKPGKPKGPATSLRPITILNVIRKLLSTITLRRAKAAGAESYLPDSQHAYRANRSTTDVVFCYRVLCNLTQNAVELILHKLGIDLSAAFDTPTRDGLLRAMIAATNGDEDVKRLTEVLLSDTTLSVCTLGAFSEFWASTVGTPQGDCYSPLMFTIYFEFVMRQVRGHANFPERPAADVTLALPTETQYADDLDVLSTDKSYLEAIAAVMEEVFARPGVNLSMNPDKTEYTRISRTDSGWKQVQLLGSRLGCAEDLKRRAQLAGMVYRRLYSVMIQPSATLATRLRLYRAYVESTMLYNIGCAGFSAAGWDKLDAVQRRHLRGMLRVYWPNQLSNSEVYTRTAVERWSVTACRRRWQQLGHVLRLPPTTPARQALVVAAEEKYRTRKGPKTHGLWIQLCHDYQLVRSPATMRFTRREQDMWLHGAPVLQAICEQEKRGKYQRITTADLADLTARASHRTLWAELTEDIVRVYDVHRRAHEVDMHIKRRERRAEQLRRSYLDMPNEPAPAPTRAQRMRAPTQQRSMPQAGQLIIGDTGFVQAAVEDPSYEPYAPKRPRRSKKPTQANDNHNQPSISDWLLDPQMDHIGPEGLALDTVDEGMEISDQPAPSTSGTLKDWKARRRKPRRRARKTDGAQLDQLAQQPP